MNSADEQSQFQKQEQTQSGQYQQKEYQAKNNNNDSEANNQMQSENSREGLNTSQKQGIQIISTQEIKDLIGNGVQNQHSPVKQSSNKNIQNANRLKEFERVREIGRGAYGTVYKVRNKKNQYLAMKEVSSIKLKKDKKVHQVYMEKIMRHFKFAGIPEFHSCFTQDNQFYFVMGFAEGGQLSRLIKRYYQHFTAEVVRFYIAEMVLILEYIHSIGFSHRDFKPENLVLTKQGHLQLIDFGTLNDYCKKLIPPAALQEVKLKDDYRRSKIMGEKLREVRKRQQSNVGMNEQQLQEEDMHEAEKKKSQQIDLSADDKEEIEQRMRSQTFCGTAEYLAPEMLEEDICDMNGDLWALGCIIYKMFTNNTPFAESQEFLIFAKIKQGNYNRNHEQIPPLARDLIAKLLTVDQHERLGSVIVDESISIQTIHSAYDKIKAHPFFEGIVWQTLYQQQPPKLIEQFLSGQFDIIKKGQQQSLDHQGQKNSNSQEDDGDDDDDENNKDDDDGDDEEEGEDDAEEEKFLNGDNLGNDKMQRMQQENDQLPTVQKLMSVNLNMIDRNSDNQKLESLSMNLRKHNSADLSQSPQKQDRNSVSNCKPYSEVLQQFQQPFTEANLFFQAEINKVNKHLLIFSTKRPRQILLFNIDPITIIYYMPFRKEPSFKHIILDEKTTILLESANRIVFQDQSFKYIFEDRKVDTPSQLYQAIQTLKQSKQN